MSTKATKWKGNKEKIFGDGYIMSYTRQTSEGNGDRIILDKMITMKKMIMIKKNDYNIADKLVL